MKPTVAQVKTLKFEIWMDILMRKTGLHAKKINEN